MTDTISITIDLAGLKIKDLVLFDKIRTGEMSQAAIVELLDRVVVGGASELPLTQLNQVLEAVTKALGEIANPKAPTV